MEDWKNFAWLLVLMACWLGTIMAMGISVALYFS